MSSSPGTVNLRHGASNPSKPSINACLPCRKVKMRCVTTENTGKCDRCTRKSLECTFRQHRRGRKPGMRLMPKAARKDSTHTTKHSQRDIAPAKQPSERGRGTDFWADSGRLQPDALLSHQAMKGKFSLQNILSTDHGSTADDSTRSTPVSPDDPLSLGIVNHHVALFLFEYFMGKMNPYICQLDPHLHSFQYIREKSPFLLTTVLAASSKAFQSELYPSLHEHAEKLFADSFRRGEKSTEIVQAIMLLTYWKEPNDTRAWTSIGLAIRIAMDLGWHKLSPDSSGRNELSDIKQREKRNVERTLLVLFVYDRSLSLQTGKPWMIERTDFIESIETWGKDPLADTNDNLLCSFVALRLLTGETFDLLPSQRKHSMSHQGRFFSVLKGRIESWESKWLNVVGPGTCHSFLIRLYGAHLRLQLFSIPLQETGIPRTDGVRDMTPFWVSYDNAITMLGLVTEYAPLLYLVQDSIHVMTAYAAVFLVKILLSAPTTITYEIENSTLKTIRDAAKVFADQSSPAGSSCSLQSRFLEKLLFEFTTIRNSRVPASQDPQSQLIASQPDLRPLLSQPTGSQGYTPEGQEVTPEGYRDICGSAINATLGIAGQPDEATHFPFCDDDMWADIFANTGFSTQEGVFYG
ncbi:hypothetical protein BDV59DRAFT_177663 [Aspergillus ambiguus]|uniref:Zn(II)2Cys6 transcription factor n=1 Tax=Aspergillus ambiguus TaxID=176160 RepID=UPI003CCD1790